MIIDKLTYPFIAFLLVLFPATAMTAGNTEVMKLTETYGCSACHAATNQKAKKGGKPVLPVGPSYPAIAKRFYSNSNPEKYQELYRIIKHGSSPYRSYYQGKISGLAMPPNDDTISDLDINRMLVWILTSFNK